MFQVTARHRGCRPSPPGSIILLSLLGGKSHWKLGSPSGTILPSNLPRSLNPRRFSRASLDLASNANWTKSNGCFTTVSDFYSRWLVQKRTQQFLRIKGVRHLTHSWQALGLGTKWSLRQDVRHASALPCVCGATRSMRTRCSLPSGRESWVILFFLL